MTPDRTPPQPHPSRVTDFSGHPLVVGVMPGMPPLVAVTAANLARATSAPAIYFGYVDPGRYAEQEFLDGTVDHRPLDPDLLDDSWQDRERELTQAVDEAMTGQGVSWHFRYLAGRPDRSLTHLARAVDAAAFVVGAHVGHHHRVLDFVNGSLSVQLSHRQHRPVVVVPLEVVDWQGKAPWE